MDRLQRWGIAVILAGALFLGSCSLPQVTPEARIFLNLSLEYLGNFSLPQTKFEGTTVGGFSALTYDRQQDRVYALSDDRAQPRYYTLKVTLSPSETEAPTLEQITVEAVTFLQTPQDEPYPSGQLDPEGLALTQERLFLSSEGVAAQQSPPFLGAFNVATGTLQETLRLPNHLLSAPERAETSESTSGERPAQGVVDNLGLEALTVSPGGDRLFTATEFPLYQDYDPDAPDAQPYNRLLHYWIGEPNPLLLAEHLYPLAPPPAGAVLNGLTEFAAIDGGGHFLSLERSYSPFTGYSAQIFQFAMAGATDTTQVERLITPLTEIQPVPKQPLFAVDQLGFPLGNLEGMMVGPTLTDGGHILLLVSDNGFDPKEKTQFLLFRLTQNPQYQTPTPNPIES